DSEEVLDLYSGYHALVVGIGDYRYGWKDLPNAVEDAKGVSRMLRDLGWNVDFIENPNGKELNLKLNELIVDSAQDSNKGVLVWFSGHGHTQEKADGTPLGYLVPSDAPDPNHDPGGFLTTAINMDRILSVSNQIRAKHVLMIFDSCFSGTLFATTRSARPSPYIQRKVAKPVRQFITAGQAEEVVPDNSVFHKTFLAGIEGREADLNEDSYITGTELGSYLAEKVTNYSGGSQNPVFGKIQNPSLDKGDFVFALAAPAIELESGLTARSNQVDKRVIELEVWREIKGTEDPSLYEQFLRQFPDGVFSGLARHRLSLLTPSGELGWCATMSAVFESTREYCDTRKGWWSTLYSASSVEYQRVQAKIKKSATAEETKKTEVAKARRERDENEAVSAFGAMAWAIKEQVRENWNEPGDFSGLSVAFLVRVDREGNVLWVKMNRSSGNPRLDESAENAIFKASPLPFPKDARFYEYLKEFNFVFKPEKGRNETQASLELQDSDRRLAAQTLQKALESTKDGAETDWQNPKTGNR
ncbi:MAG: cell envelope integrity protein TolA, partial [Alphaproteobacteria bacterium]|nr:cell envelope integrity protein TolA [Alphaproteobacteria bacterium]